MKPGSRVAALASLVLSAFAAAACTSSTPADATGLQLALGSSLPGAKGMTIADQDAIDDTVAGGCAIRFYDVGPCRRHTKASAERRRELAQ